MLKNSESKKYVGLAPSLVSLLSIAFFNSTAGDYIQPLDQIGTVRPNQKTSIIGEIKSPQE